MIERQRQATMATQRDGSILWVALFTAASAVTTAALACATPFPALAALAAAHLGRRHGLALMLIGWGVSQVVGIGLHHYPHDPSTIGWGVTLGLASVAALLGGSRATLQLARKPAWMRLACGYGAAFVAFKLAVLGGGLLLGGVGTALAPTLIARQLVRDGLILFGLHLFYRVLREAGVPAPHPRQVQTA